MAWPASPSGLEANQLTFKAKGADVRGDLVFSEKLDLIGADFSRIAIARAADLALRIFEQDKVLEKNQQTSAYATQQLTAWSGMPIKHVRQQGMIWAFDVETSNATFQQDFYQQAIARGLLLRPIGKTVYFMPPYVITRDEIDFMLNTTQEVLALCA